MTETTQDTTDQNIEVFKLTEPRIPAGRVITLEKSKIENELWIAVQLESVVPSSVIGMIDTVELTAPVYSGILILPGHYFIFTPGLYTPYH